MRSAGREVRRKPGAKDPLGRGVRYPDFWSLRRARQTVAILSRFVTVTYLPRAIILANPLPGDGDWVDHRSAVAAAVSARLPRERAAT